jgi:hypothetical protein
MALIALAGAVTNASAQEKSRAEVRQELIQAENNGSRFVTDTSYPDVDPIFSGQVARMQKQSDSGVGGAIAGAGETGHSVKSRSSIGAPSTSPACVGPASFCSPYFGS